MLPIFLSEFDCYEQLAVKEKSLGRSKGGLIVLVNKSLLSKLVEKNEWCIWLEIKINDKVFILNFLYLNPLYNIAEYLISLSDTITDICNTYDKPKIIILGDFNARIGNSNSYDETYDNEIFDGLECSARRESLDLIYNQRGNSLVKCMETLGFIVLNGRFPNDKPAQFTFVNSQGNKSMVDQAWANTDAIEEITNIEVSDFVLSSDHLPVIISLKNSVPFKSNNKKKEKKFKNNQIKWKEDNKTKFIVEQNRAQQSFRVDNSVDCGGKKLTESIQQLARASNMLKEKPVLRQSTPWFDKTCYEFKCVVKKKFKEYKKSNYNQQNFEGYKNTKSEYNYLLKQKKKQYFEQLQTNLSNVKSSKNFWNTINQFKGKKKTPHNQISVNIWEHFLKDLYSSKHTENFEVVQHTETDLDEIITQSELDEVISKSKPNKAAGPDQISNEFYKNLNTNWKEGLLNLFNKILNEESVPKSWAEINLYLLYKKGDKNDTNNYRSISLLNNVTKLLTTILTNRLENWADKRNIFCEEQFGFRKGRGCLDAIFTLYSTVSINTRLSKRKVFATFVDFRKAFDSVCHHLLWQKLITIGLSSKLIKIFQSLYENASLQITVDGETSNPIYINRGVLQGESASPLLFNLFINDLVSYMKERNVRGVNINSEKDIALILYADDLVLLADTPGMMQKALDVLSNYCTENFLEINYEKTKTMIFSAGGKHKMTSFKIKGETIEIVNEFQYLGVTFSPKNVFLKATEKAIKKSHISLDNIVSLMSNSKLQSWKGRQNLFNSSVKASLLYASEIWSLRYLDELEKVQNRFYKRVFNWQLTTPGYIIRQETNSDPISSTVIRRTLYWWRKLRNMDQGCIQNQCYRRLLQLDLCGGTKNKFNWVSQLKEILKTIDDGNIDFNMSLSEYNIDRLVSQYTARLSLLDAEKINNSTYCPVYKLIKEDVYVSTYITKRIHFKKIKLISQLRVSGQLFTKFYCNGCIYKWDQRKICEVCNMNVAESLLHFLFECPAYSPFRKELDKYGTAPTVNTNELFCLLLSNLNNEKINVIYYYFCNSLKTRSFVLNE